MPKNVQILHNITVINLGVGMSAALAAKFMAELGATVIRVEPPEGDPFDQVYPAYNTWQQCATNNAEAAQSSEHLNALLSQADICLTGGEDHPEVIRQNRATTFAADFPRLIILDIEGYPAGTEDAARPACDLLIQARSGLIWEHFTDRPIPMSFSPSCYGATLRGLCGIFAALYEREASGKGQLVSTSLYEGALTWAAGLWFDIENPTPTAQFVMPKNPYPLVFRCADGRYIHLVIGGTGSKYGMYQALEIDDPTVSPNDSGMPKPTGDPKNFFGDIDLLAEHAAKKNSTELLQRIWDQNLPAEPVLAPGECWDLPQIKHNGLVLTDDKGVRHIGHPIASQASSAPYKKSVMQGIKPLSGVNIVDLGAFVAGPYASVILADLGAEVIKVEPPAGDPNRSLFRSYSAVNRGKQAISINMKDPEGLAIVKSLCVNSDVITSNFRSGVSKRLGIDPSSLHALKPSLVVLESPGYGSDGPLAKRAAFDMVFQALCGHEHRAGGKDNAPLWNRTSMVDYTGGLVGALASISALYHRARTGEGMTLNSPLLNAGVYLLSEVIQQSNGEFAGNETFNASRTGLLAAESLYQTSDGWIALVVRGKVAAAAFKNITGLHDLNNNPMLWGETDSQTIADFVSIWSTTQALDTLEQAGVWAEDCRQNRELATLNDPALIKANVVQVSQHPEFGTVRELGAMLRFSRSAVGHHRPAPLQGESTHALLTALGYSDAKVQSLIEKSVIA